MRITSRDIHSYTNERTISYYMNQYKRYIGEPMFLNHGDIDYVIAGGFFNSVDTRRPIQDIDIYPKTQDDKDKLINILLRKGWTSENVRSDGVQKDFVKYGKKIQVMQPHNSTVKELLANFDFRICMVGYWSKTRMIYKTVQYDRDLRGKRLVYNQNNPNPIKNIPHLMKYIKYGFNISPIDLMTICMRINLLDLDKENVFKEQLMYYESTELLSHYKKVYEELKEDCYEDCKLCGNGITGFRDELSVREYGISGMCQECQDSVFG